MKNYQKFVDAMVELHNARWAGVILKDGTVAAYNSLDDECREKCLRSARSFYWSVMSMGEMLDLPNLEGRYLEIIWKQEDSHIYVYIFVFPEEVVIISTEKKMEEYFVELINCITKESGVEGMPGMLSFFTGDCNGNITSMELNDEELLAMSNGMDRNALTELVRDKVRELFSMYAGLNRAGFGQGKYIEMIWENMSIWLFPHEDGIGMASFKTEKVETLFNIINYLLELSGER